MDALWTVRWNKEAPTLKNALLIVGLPGIGNVGKIAADFIITEKKVPLIATFFSYHLPHSVYVNEQNLIELPKIGLYHLKAKTRDILIIAGDVQPMNELSCYTFCDTVLHELGNRGLREIITFGGIGLRAEPPAPRLFCTGTEQSHVAALAKTTGASQKIYGVVGPIIGVSGVLLGLAQEKGILGAALLAETLSHPLYLGTAGAQALIVGINAYTGLKLPAEAVSADQQQESLVVDEEGPAKKLVPPKKNQPASDTNYIG